MTNAEYIRCMDDEQLADFLLNVWNNAGSITPDCWTGTVCYGECTESTKCVLKWLQTQEGE